VDKPFFTIGHSNRTIAVFIELLRGAEVALVADVRRMPGSRANPQFDGPALAAALAPHQIGYEHMAALGGLRSRAPDAAPETNALWTNKSFHNYADYALTEPFQAGLARLLELGQQRRCAIMCSEAVWWRCHRRIVADYLLASGEKVFHIMGEGRLEPARLTPGAVVGPDHEVYYPLARGGAMEPPGRLDVPSRRSD
jgi:uncharacterized protein (DUF488 family)